MQKSQIQKFRSLKALKACMTSVAILWGSQVLANAPLFIWDNQTGLSVKRDCEILATDEVPFEVSSYYGKGDKGTENLRNYNGVRQSHLVNYSVVKISDGKKKRSYQPVEVVGVNQRTGANINRWYSKRKDKGYLYDHSVRPMEDFVFEVNLDQSQMNHRYTKNLDINKDQPLYLRIASGLTYYKAVCKSEPEREYLIFRTYQRHYHDQALFYLGISHQETEVFKNLKTFGKVESMSFLNEVGQENPIQVSFESLRASIEADQLTLEETISQELERLQEEVTLHKGVSSEEVVREESNDESPVEDRGEVSEKVGDLQNEEEENSTLVDVVCVGGISLNVRDESLDKVLFKAVTGEQVKFFQSWEGKDTFTSIIGGVEYTFKKVEFSEREEKDQKVGFVATNFIKKRNKCPYLRNTELDRGPHTKISGLDDTKCCDFPTAKKPTHPYTSGMRRFRAGRSGGRLHAACDLYRYINEPIRSVAPGRVLRDPYYFYQGTYAVEVQHSGGFVVRYGELNGRHVVKSGQNLKMSERLGFMGKVNSNCCRPMLHFELYSGEKTGTLSGGGRYQRRSDLMDPTSYLLKWEDEVF